MAIALTDMMTLVPQLNVDNLEAYQVVSRREIKLLLRNIQSERQLVKMIYNSDGESIVTSILEVDPVDNTLIIDCAQNEKQNQKIAEQASFSFDTSLQKVRIMFFSNHIERCDYEGQPAFKLALPRRLIRLQRREVYRVRVPRTPVVVPMMTDKGVEEITAYLQDLSTGGIGMLDESQRLDYTIGRNYENCRITLLDKSVIVATLQVRNSQEISLASGKVMRRFGCQFIDLPNNAKLNLQRLITKIEREQNAKSSGIQ
ncbi:MAG: flagellar brake protein [Oxalobacter sp.]|nr:MAG: flagellar brake protein [Oxalobacter sp.]